MIRILLVFFSLFLSLGLFSQVQVGSSFSSSHKAYLSGAGDRVLTAVYDSDSQTYLSSVFEYSSGSWSQLGSNVTGLSSMNILSISKDGSTIAMGSNNTTGFTRIHSWDGSSWNQLGSDITGDTGDGLGYDLELNEAGNKIVLGGHISDDGPNGTNSGEVRVYSWNGSSWGQLGSTIYGGASGDQLGVSVSINAEGDRIAMGGNGYDDGANSAAGIVKIYEYSGGVWSQLGSDLVGSSAGDEFGINVSLNSSGNRVVIGAYLDGPGSVSVYEYSSGSWSLMGSVVSGETNGDYFGHAVAFNSAGDKFVAGAPLNSDGGSFAGHVRSYAWNGSNWVQVGNDIDGDEGETIGYESTISISGSGERIATRYFGQNAVFAPHIHDSYSFSPIELSSSSLTASGETSVGRLSVNDVIVDGSSIGHTNDEDLLTLSSGVLTVAGDLTVTSDARLKQNIVPLGSTLATLMRLETKQYLMKDDSSQRVKIGLLAQEVKEIFPELVSENSFGILSVDYQGLVPIIIEALKEQEKNYKELEEELSKLNKLNQKK